MTKYIINTQKGISNSPKPLGPQDLDENLAKLQNNTVKLISLKSLFKTGFIVGSL